MGDVFSHNTIFPFMALEEGFKNATQTNAGVIEDPRVHCHLPVTALYCLIHARGTVTAL